MTATILPLTALPDTLIARLESRDVALWIRELPRSIDRERLLAFLGLPWRLVISEAYDPGLFQALESTSGLADPLVRKRGFVQFVDVDPSRTQLPERCLRFFLLNGRQREPREGGFGDRLRRLTMLEELRRSTPRDILVVSDKERPIPPDIVDLWSHGFRTHLTLLSAHVEAEATIRTDVSALEGGAAVGFLRAPLDEAVESFIRRYAESYPEDRRVIRVRDRKGHLLNVDITTAEDPERPLLEWYSLVQERDLKPLMPEDLSEDDFVAFFRSPELSWRPYAAGLPWKRDTRVSASLERHLKKLDSIGSEANAIAYIASESGSGGTTLARMLAWECAHAGYPVLLAKPIPFIPDALPVANFLHLAHLEIEKARASPGNSRAIQGDSAERYEVPWLIVFDTVHWQYRDNELARFRTELEKSGRPVCVLSTTSTVLGVSFYGPSFRKLTELNHAITEEQARDLGAHLNRFLRLYGKERRDAQWVSFYREHTVRYLEGTAAFWVSLSFWIQGQYDLTESLQQWIYRCFKANARDRSIRLALLEIAALASERLPLPDSLLPESHGQWPLSHLLEDARAALSGLGLVRPTAGGTRYWALIHDILGRFLVNAVFFDYEMRQDLGFGAARDAEHLRFLILQQIAQKAALGERVHREFGEEFATSIFKVDPDHGHATFAILWRDVLNALDTMPRPLRDTSRVFRHHTAVSRRRIAKLDEALYDVSESDRLELLERAVEDINYALKFIPYAPGSEPDLNLYNSLANAFFDLAELESDRGAPRERIAELRRAASEATRRAYEESPTNSFVTETYVRNLLQAVRGADNRSAVQQCIEALGIVFSALASNAAPHRAAQLGSLADEALAFLLKQAPSGPGVSEPKTAIDVLVMAWLALAETDASLSETPLTQIATERYETALEILRHPAGTGNMQVIRLRYDLLSIIHPFAYGRQLEEVEQLQATNYRLTPQLRLEYAVLLFQRSRASEGDRVFRSLRMLWRESEHFVQVPERLRWLRTESQELKHVRAVVASDAGGRAMARVPEFGHRAQAPFRAEEFGLRDLRPGMRLTCHVSFGHNGPFLRPATGGTAISRG